VEEDLHAISPIALPVSLAMTGYPVNPRREQ
jgi:hypothetical protein